MSSEHPNPAEAYDQYLGPAIFHPWAELLLEQAAPRAGEQVLDLACGTGIVTRKVAPLAGEGGRVVALDISPDMLAIARAAPGPAGASIEWMEGNASELPLPRESVDLVLCQQGLQFFPDRAAAVRGMREVLAEGGRAVVAVWRSLEHHPVFNALFTAEARHLGVNIAKLATPFSLGDAEELRGLFLGAGFQRVDLHSVSHPVEFPTPERFVALTVMAGAAVIPDLNLDDPAAHDALVQSVARDAEGVLSEYRQADRLAFAMSANIVVAYR